MSTAFQQQIDALIANIEKVIIGKRDVVELLLVGVIARGHVLLEDVPGVGKTMLARSLAKSLRASFGRVQCTPDLLPSDIVGASIYNQKTAAFEFRPGPIFVNIFLVDEINRTTPRTQSGLLECMQEFNVTVDGTTHPLPKPFFVIATENPIEFRGTYPLPEAQLDRFLLKLEMGYPSKLSEEGIMMRYLKQAPLEALEPVGDLASVQAWQEAMADVHVEKAIMTYIMNIIAATREHPEVQLGVSPRGTLALMQAARALAVVEGRDYVIPMDIKRLAPAVLRHRLVLRPRAAAKGLTAKRLLEQLLDTTPV